MRTRTRARRVGVTLRTAGVDTGGRTLAVSLHVAGESGPMTQHAKALTTSYVTWLDVLSRRLHAEYGDRVSVVNAGISGNRVVGPADYAPWKPFAAHT